MKNHDTSGSIGVTAKMCLLGLLAAAQAHVLWARFTVMGRVVIAQRIGQISADWHGLRGVNFWAATLACIYGLAGTGSAMAMDAADAQNWRDDVRTMAREMRRLHKNLFHTVSESQFNAMVQALDANIPKLERHEVIVEMARIVAAVGDGHTNIYPTRDARIGFHNLPVAFSFFEDALVVRAAHVSAQQWVGAKVLAVGDAPVDVAYAKVKTLIGRDNEQGARYWAPYLLAMPEVLHALRLVPQLGLVTLTLETEPGQQHQVVLPVHELAPIMSGDTVTQYQRRPDWVDLRDRATAADPMWLRHVGEMFRFEHVGKLLYVQINQVGNKPDESLAAFAKRLRAEIIATRPEKLAIDLRLNRGGDATLIAPLLRTIVQSTEIDEKGRLFAFIGPGTFSAAQMLADDLEKYTQVTFVGEPSGSKGNAYGDSRRITLPHSGMTVRASVYYWQEWHPLDARSAITPAIAAPLTLEAYRRNADPALDAVLALP